MAERHTIDFARDSVAVVSDADRRRITLQFEGVNDGQPTAKRLWTALQRRYGPGPLARIGRWSRGEDHPLILPARGQPHPESPDVFVVEVEIRPGPPMEEVLSDLLEFFRRQPGYVRTYGDPLDRDLERPPSRRGAARETSEAANAVLWQMLIRRNGESAVRPDKKRPLDEL